MRPPTPTIRARTLNRAASALAAVTLSLALTGVPVAHAQTGISSEPLPAGVANGTPASLAAVLRPVTPASLVRTYDHSALRVSSQLLDTAGQPISHAQIDILQQVEGSSKTEVVGHAITSVDGTFTALVPAGPSRTIGLAYRSYEGALLYAAQTEILETVTAGLRLHITPRRTGPTGTIVLHGEVLGILPAHGVIVEVLVYYQGVWEPIRTPQTSRTGRFRLQYQFHHALGTFPFALGVRDGQVGFPYAGARSARIDVVTRLG